MRVRRSSLAALALLIWACALALRLHSASPQAPRSPSLVDFEGEIRPIIETKCLECHSTETRKGGLSLASYGDALDGGRSGPAIRPGHSATSLLLHRITGEIEPQMPKDEPPLTANDVALFRLWIDQGARATPTSPPAPPPWEAPLALERPAVPDEIWAGWTSPLDRLVSAYLTSQQVSEPQRISDARFLRRAYLDIWGLLPTPEESRAFLADTRADKRGRLVAALLADDRKYAEHWISFWNDLLRNEDGVTYFSESASRKSITDWLLASLSSNLPYDQFVSKLLNPAAPGDPDGFLVGVNWRGETSAAVTPWMQASQNTAQIFLGVNLKCNACHDSFINKWKLKDAYALAGFFSPEPRLRLYRCEKALEQYAEPAFLFPELNRLPPSGSLADRRATAAAIFTDPRNGRVPRTLVNRIWDRLFGHGIVANPDEMDGRPWSPDVLDWLASDFVDHGYDVKRLISTIVTSRAYQMPSIARADELPARGYVFRGPEIRRVTAEQFADAIGAITGEWSLYYPPGRRPARDESDPPTAGVYAREWRAASSDLTRALGRPIRDQVIAHRASQATTLQALELVNGEILTRWLSAGARRMLGETRPAPLSLFNKAVAGRNAASSAFDVDIATATRVWLVVRDTGSNAPERVLPAWMGAELVGPSGSTLLSTLTPVEASGPRPVEPASHQPGTVPVVAPSVLVYDVAGKGYTRLRGRVGLENPANEIGATLNPQVRFFIFDTEPDMERLVPPSPETPLPSPPPVREIAPVVERVFWHALGRAPSPEERRIAEAALTDAAGRGRASADGLADLLWAVLMKPEFQLIY
jgi:hypothetical protein